MDRLEAMLTFLAVPARKRQPRAATKGILIGLSALLLAGAQFPYARLIAQEAIGPHRSAPQPTVLSADAERAMASTPGSEFRECARGCPVMAVIPAGRFMMGSPDHEPDRRTSEGPQHEVIFRVPFAVSRFEVTFEQWDACVAASACARATDAWGRGAMPVVNVSWDDARQYVSWLSQLTGREYRLPTEAEWEYAARAGTSSRYAWGDEPGAENANCAGCSDKWSLQTAPVGSFKPNAFGLNDMHGNVWEWTEDVWHDSYHGAPADGSAWIEGDRDYRTIRGASWHNETELARAAVRFARHRKVQFDTLGFRVARTMRP
ncbi:formylglycine-generating enzyme family protein [Bradyrhizobium sp. AUGA SZCCT0169]|uniref:formylglycine-generating enzyme family protein n=1 Tax=Bradyrhizobium sp. AUGA SZCCT0169 TaxID=2807663 RepID=UPI001BA54D74|nr:formylglycine-generating enzyme family protein [Bradyrhizobium sp. AUGA SZCCT0169]MBR1249548.1 formylglycine-generating enzyme family protein [Bradyrhizobium sp. AUGA SZCCT0169]